MNELLVLAEDRQVKNGRDPQLLAQKARKGVLRGFTQHELVPLEEVEQHSQLRLVLERQVAVLREDVRKNRARRRLHQQLVELELQAVIALLQQLLLRGELSDLLREAVVSLPHLRGRGLLALSSALVLEDGGGGQQGHLVVIDGSVNLVFFDDALKAQSEDLERDGFEATVKQKAK